MEKKHCINCMELYDGNVSRCPHCGYEQTAEPFPFGVKPETILRGRYLVGRVLGQGGFGITYVGYDLTLELKVAVKEYFPAGIVTRNHTVSNRVQWNTVQLDGEQWKRGCESFLKEARRMAKLDSLPGIVRVRDTFPENGTAYIIMDFVEGENLKQKLIKNGVMGLGQCITVLRPLMESLGKMHGKGLVHRDISPDNIMVGPDGSACLLDFGAAKDITLHQSMSSQQVAKKGFSPPEQYREKGNIGPWTDVYALCATIYYCVTGRLIPDAIDRMYDETVNFDGLSGKPIGEAAAEVLRDGLRVHTEKRIQTVEELLERLDSAAGESPGTDKQAEHEQGNGAETQEGGGKAQNPSIDAKERGKSIPEDPAGQVKRKVNKKINKKAFGAIAAAVAAVLALVLMLVQTQTRTQTVKSSGADRGMASDEALEQKQPVTAPEETPDHEDGEPETVNLEDEEPSNILMRDDQCEISDDDHRYHGTVFGSEISRDSIKSVTFMDTLEGMPDAAWDVSQDQDGSVMAWAQQSTDNNSDGEMYDLFIAGEGGVQGRDCRQLFQGYYSVEKINFNDCFDTSQVTDMCAMFDQCSNLMELDVSGFVTGQVTNMKIMFQSCSSLTELDVSGFKTGEVTNMFGMFNICSSLTELDVSGFNTSEVMDMSYMFSSCSSLTELDVSGFKTGEVTNMYDMFCGCSSLTELDVSGFKTGEVTNMSGMFARCSSLTELDVSGFVTDKVTDMSGMFAWCSSLTELDVSGFATGKETDMSYMFNGCGITAEEAGLRIE